MLHTSPAADAAAAPAVDAVAAGGASDDVSKPFSRLSMCDRGLRDTFQSCMSKEVKARVKEMEARLKKLDHLENTLRGFMFLSPHQKLEKFVAPLNLDPLRRIEVSINRANQQLVIFDILNDLVMKQIEDFPPERQPNGTDQVSNLAFRTFI